MLLKCLNPRLPCFPCRAFHDLFMGFDPTLRTILANRQNRPAYQTTGTTTGAMAGWAQQPAVRYDTRPWDSGQQLQNRHRRDSGAVVHHHVPDHPQRSRNHSAHRPHHHHHNHQHRHNHHGGRHQDSSSSQNALVAATGDYVARRLVPQLQSGAPSRPVSLFMNYGTMVVPSTDILSPQDSTSNTTAANAVLFNAPGSTMILTPPPPPRPRRPRSDGAVYSAHVAGVPVSSTGGSSSTVYRCPTGNYVVAGAGRGRLHRAGSAVLASCPGCGLLRTTSGGYCRDCDMGASLARDGAVALARRYLVGAKGRFLGN
ncbi:hypothetical protein GGTG_13134 [Gaeumannomyces tritici R3-111a-1]|uniref:Uncharacterized protein n=1 Tax=Gaeumannomyces tritici (strain R3-111a-1) TaxID=644352 RepID=J3PI03_GAET3|nr:hypothetical protein GGTG_13134 [Gaeumannomyces tritici R3-111a-1]EJT69515.1 hypothetical protein GGTG_13134 [Gaeumannomyces tritici R3-111a-1]